jgi:hypothetical protein
MSAPYTGQERENESENENENEKKWKGSALGSVSVEPIILQQRALADQLNANEISEADFQKRAGALEDLLQSLLLLHVLS